jgi:Tfp pilus assembly protein PilV
MNIAKVSPRAAQRGATLVVGLIMLVLITVMVTSAFTLSSSNLKSVGNMQARDEAIAAANRAIEQIIASPFTDEPAAEEIHVDIDNDGAPDYIVAFSEPECVSGVQVSVEDPAGPVDEDHSEMALTTSGVYATVWDLAADVVSASGDGTRVRVHQGVRKLLDEDQFNDVCST